ncbi:MAG TPA: phosphomannomutase/phosphoglucomutase [Blastocatellia bacterium]
MNQHIFREYDIRGVVGTDLSDAVVSDVALGIGAFMRGRGVTRISIGRDARESSPRFRDILIEGLNQSGCDVLDAGMVPTPLLYYTLFTQPVGGGVMITGSHNPADNNGFKICYDKSTVFGEHITEIRDIIASRKFNEPGSGKVDEVDVIPEYLDYVFSNVKLGARKLKVVVDSGNGMGGIVAVPLYRRMGCEVVELFTDPDSRFPNHHPDPTVVENMRSVAQTVIETGADFGIAFDGDADRIGVVDERGRIIWGDRLMIIYARSILKYHPGATFIAEVKCSDTLFQEIREKGGNPIMWRVGHSPIKAKMKESGALLAGEMSGHQFFADQYFGYDDAIYAGARLLEIISKTDGPVSSLLDGLPETVFTPEIRVDCSDDKKFEVVTALTEEFKKTHPVIDIDGARIVFDGGWGLVRASNTQPVLVLRFEARNQDLLDRIRSEVEGKLAGVIGSKSS